METLQATLPKTAYIGTDEHRIDLEARYSSFEKMDMIREYHRINRTSNVPTNMKSLMEMSVLMDEAKRKQIDIEEEVRKQREGFAQLDAAKENSESTGKAVLGTISLIISITLLIMKIFLWTQ